MLLKKSKNFLIIILISITFECISLGDNLIVFKEDPINKEEIEIQIINQVNGWLSIGFSTENNSGINNSYSFVSGKTTLNENYFLKYENHTIKTNNHEIVFKDPTITENYMFFSFRRYNKFSFKTKLSKINQTKTIYFVNSQYQGETPTHNLNDEYFIKQITGLEETKDCDPPNMLVTQYSSTSTIIFFIILIVYLMLSILLKNEQPLKSRGYYPTLNIVILIIITIAQTVFLNQRFDLKEKYYCYIRIIFLPLQWVSFLTIILSKIFNKPKGYFKFLLIVNINKNHDHFIKKYRYGKIEKVPKLNIRVLKFLLRPSIRIIAIIIFLILNYAITLLFLLIMYIKEGSFGW
jgi:hypothetical protein